ncbi:MAG: RidA family protein [Candidatus Hodarchaeales archaeon]|jgi:2-iminobutanoate/2-iminopropanoate deaminase
MKRSVKYGTVVGPYSPAIIASGEFIFVSGQIATNLDADTAQQTGEALGKIKNILIEAKATMNNIVKITVLLADINDYNGMNEVYKTFFDETPPARAAFQVAALPLNAKIEIEAIAILDK